MVTVNRVWYKVVGRQFTWVPIHSISHGRVTWAWRWHPKKFSWWMLIPYPIQRWWVHHENTRYCSLIGHDDTLFHLKEEGIIGGEAKCSDCSAPVLACTGSGFTHRRD